MSDTLHAKAQALAEALDDLRDEFVLAEAPDDAVTHLLAAATHTWEAAHTIDPEGAGQ